MIVALLLWAGCDSTPDAATPAPSDCQSLAAVDWAGFGEGFFRSYCTSCHSTSAVERRGAPDGLDFDTQAGVRLQADAIRAAVLDHGTMPVGGGVPDDDLALLTIYLDCGLE